MANSKIIFSPISLFQTKINNIDKFYKPVETKRTNHEMFISPERLSLETHCQSNSKNIATDLLQEIKKKELERFAISRQVLTFDEFLEEAINNPKKYLRSSSQYAVDAIDYWNKVKNIEESTRIKILGQEIKPVTFAMKPWEPEVLTDKTGVCGQELVLDEIYSALKTNAKKKYPNRMIILHGPNATGKTLILETLYEALEHYSKQDEGVLYTYNWVFKNNDDEENDNSFESLFPVYSGPNAIKAQNKKSKESKESKDATVTIPATLNTNPIFLLNDESRLKLISILEEKGKINPEFNKDYIISGSQDRIFDALWKLYDGDINKILSHVEVIRWTLSPQNRKGLVVIPPEETPEAHLTPITPEIDWNNLPVKIKEAFRSAGLYELEGPFPQANRGHIFFDDMMKHGNIGQYLFLLRTAEKGKITISTADKTKSVDEKLDLVIWGTINDSTLHNLQQKYGDWDSLKERFTFIPVGYERCYRSVENIYRDQLKQMISPTRHISPYVLESFALWNTMTYLFPPLNNQYYDSLDLNEERKKLLKNAVMKLKPDSSRNSVDMLYKALLYQGEDLNSYELDPKKQKFNIEEKIILNKHLKEIANEYNLGVSKNKFIFYEGSTGLSPRDGRRIVEDFVKTKPTECLSVLEVFDTVSEWIKHGLDYDEERKNYIGNAKAAIEQVKKTNQDLNLPSIPDFIQFPTAAKLLEQVRDHTKRKIRFDVSIALEFIKSDEEHVRNLRKYVEHVKAQFNKTDVSPEWRIASTTQPNEQFMREMERIFNSQEFSDIESSYGRDKFRQMIRENLGLWTGSRENENQMDNLERIFPDLITRMKSKDLEDNKQKLYDFLYDIKVYYGQGQKDPFSREGYEHVEDVTNKMKSRMELLNQGLHNLKKGHYCDKCIPKLIDFAFNEPEYKNTKMRF